MKFHHRELIQSGDIVYITGTQKYVNDFTKKLKKGGVIVVDRHDLGNKYNISDLSMFKRMGERVIIRFPESMGSGFEQIRTGRWGSAMLDAMTCTELQFMNNHLYANGKSWPGLTYIGSYNKD